MACASPDASFVIQTRGTCRPDWDRPLLPDLPPVEEPNNKAVAPQQKEQRLPNAHGDVGGSPSTPLVIASYWNRSEQMLWQTTALRQCPRASRGAITPHGPSAWLLADSAPHCEICSPQFQGGEKTQLFAEMFFIIFFLLL